MLEHLTAMSADFSTNTGAARTEVTRLIAVSI